MSKTIEKHPGKAEYRMDPGHGAIVIIGRPDRYGGRCGPHIRAEKWRGECWLELAATSVDPHPTKREKITKDHNGDDALEIACVRDHGAGKQREELHRIRHGSTEWEVVWNDADDVPADGKLAFLLSFPAGVAFEYQPPLTAEDISDGCVRPDNVVGSYAVYWSQAGRVLNLDGSERVNYETGKFCHVYRPKLIDADGATQWCDLDITGNAMTISMPIAWLAIAAYPVTLDPNIGYESVGGSNASLSAGFVDASGAYSPATNGSATSVSVYANIANTTNFTVGIYNTVGAALVKDSAGGVGSNAAGWQTQNLDSSVTITAGTVYTPSINLAVASAVYYDTTKLTPECYVASTYSAGALPDPFPAAPTFRNRRYSAYITYTSAAVWPAMAKVYNDGTTFGPSGSDYSGTLRASNLHTGAGAPGVDLSAGIVTTGVLVDDVTGTAIVAFAASGSATLARESGANARGGSGTCAKLTATSASAYGYLNFYIDTKAVGNTFTLSFYHKIAAGFNGLLKISIYDIDAGAALLSSEAVTLTDDGAYHQHTCAQVTKGGAGLCRVRVEIEKGAAAAADIYIDDWGIA